MSHPTTTTEAPHYPPATGSSSSTTSSSTSTTTTPHPSTAAPGGYPPQAYNPNQPSSSSTPSSHPNSNPNPNPHPDPNLHPTQGYPPQSQGYPPQPLGYSPQSQGYPPMGYPPQSQGYPPMGYPPQPVGYPPLQPGYPPSPGYAGYPPPQQPMIQGLGGFPPGVFPVGVEITLRGYHGKYLTAEKPKNIAVAQTARADVWERWQVFSGASNGVCFRSWHGRYLSSDAHDKVMANVEKPQEWESFTPINVPGKIELFYLRTYNGNFLTVDAKGNVGISKTQKSTEQWSIEVVGAATQLPGSRRLTLPTGKIHLKSRYGMYVNAAPDDGVVHADAKKADLWETLEVIFQKDGKISLMGCSGKYLTVNQKGLITCTAEIAKGWEFWESIHHAGAKFNLKCFHGTFLGSTKKGVPKMYKDNEDSDTIWEVERVSTPAPK